MVTLKIILYAYFLWCYVDTKPKIEKRSKSYFTLLLKVASAYMLAIPVSIALAFVYPPYERQYMFTLLSQLTMFVTNITVFYQIVAKESSY